MPIAICGTAAPGEKVTVTFSGQNATAETDSTGNWRVKIGPLPANSTPEKLLISSDHADSPKLEIQDVLVGEVWLGAGQSNMQGPGSMFHPGLKSGDTVLSKSPGDAQLQKLINGGPYPEVRIITMNSNFNYPVSVKWELSTPKNLLNFSAQLQSFGIQLHDNLKVPVGLMVAAVGGTASGKWLTQQALDQDPACKEELAKAKASYSEEKEKAKYEASLQKYATDQAAWEKLSEADKKTHPAPGKPHGPIKPGEMFRGPVGGLHDKVLGQLIGYTIRGVLWDQGEGGPGVIGMSQYHVMGTLIRSWRQEWGQGDFPFVYVTKPSGLGCAFDYADPIMAWASDPFQPLPEKVPNDGDSREEYIKISSYPNTFMVPTSDLGSNTHPWNKFGYGSRDLQVILGAVYQQPVEYSGPVYASSELQEGKIRIKFDHVGKGLTFRNTDKLQGFAIAGEDKKFVWADAVIDGNSVVVSSSQVPKPSYVRYAWSMRMPWANLFNLDGLPAISFRTDTN